MYKFYVVPGHSQTAHNAELHNRSNTVTTPSDTPPKDSNALEDNPSTRKDESGTDLDDIPPESSPYSSTDRSIDGGDEKESESEWESLSYSGPDNEEKDVADDDYEDSHSCDDSTRLKPLSPPSLPSRLPPPPPPVIRKKIRDMIKKAESRYIPLHDMNAIGKRKKALKAFLKEHERTYGGDTFECKCIRWLLCPLSFPKMLKDHQALIMDKTVEVLKDLSDETNNRFSTGLKDFR